MILSIQGNNLFFPQSCTLRAQNGLLKASLCELFQFKYLIFSRERTLLFLTTSMLKEQGSPISKFSYQMQLSSSHTSAKVALFITKKRFLIEKLENVPELKIPKILAKSICSKDRCVSSIFFFFHSAPLFLYLADQNCWTVQDSTSTFSSCSKKCLWVVTIQYPGLFYRWPLGTQFMEV